jgi:hypothetical protein
VPSQPPRNRVELSLPRLVVGVGHRTLSISTASHRNSKAAIPTIRSDRIQLSDAPPSSARLSCILTPRGQAAPPRRYGDDEPHAFKLEPNRLAHKRKPLRKASASFSPPVGLKRSKPAWLRLLREFFRFHPRVSDGENGDLVAPDPVDDPVGFVEDGPKVRSAWKAPSHTLLRKLREEGYPFEEPLQNAFGCHGPVTGDVLEDLAHLSLSPFRPQDPQGVSSRARTAARRSRTTSSCGIPLPSASSCSEIWMSLKISSS